MDENVLLQCLKKQHFEIELDCGNDPNCVTDDVNPLDELGGFDSLLIPNVIRSVAKDLGIPLTKGVRLRNPYVGPDGKKKLSLRNVAKRFCELYCKETTRA